MNRKKQLLEQKARIERGLAIIESGKGLKALAFKSNEELLDESSTLVTKILQKPTSELVDELKQVYDQLESHFLQKGEESCL